MNIVHYFKRKIIYPASKGEKGGEGIMKLNVKINIQLKGKDIKENMDLYRELIKKIKQEHLKTNDTLVIEVTL